MRVRCAVVVLFLAAQTFGQTVTTLNLSTQGHNPDFSNFAFTRPVSVGSVTPPTCQVGQLFFNTAARAGQNIYACTQTNTWAVTGTYTLLPAGQNSLGGVSILNNSALNVDANGVLSITAGTGAGTLAAGNDARIVNALQPTSQISVSNVVGLARSATTDTTNASNILTGTLSASLLPATISSNTNGNAATAGSLSAAPNGCIANQYAFGILANGTARCAQVGYGQVSGTPTVYNQVLQVAARAQTQRQNLNFAAGSNVSITGSDNGSNTTTLTISDIGLQAPSTANSLVKYTTGTATTAAQPSDVISVLGFTPQNASGLNAPSGYAGLDANGLLLLNEMPPVINSNTSGKAATATALAATPALCAGGQFATGIGANGSAICGTPTGTGGLPDPGSNGLIKRTGTNADAIAAAGTDYYAPGTQINDGDLPNSITSSITGNAATATALSATPTACPGGQFATGILANGNASCGTPSSGGSGVTSSTSLPAASTCLSSTVGNLYSQTMPSPPSGGQNRRFFVCQQNGTAYTWWPITQGRVNVMGFGCKADGTTDDQPCFQAAVNSAGILNRYSSWDNGGTAPYLGTDVYVPCGMYAIGSPIILPRVNTSSYTHGPNNGVVGLIGESKACTALYGLTGSGFYGVSGFMVTRVGGGYTSAPTVTLTGGCTTEPGVSSLLMGGGSGTVASVYITTPGSGCTSMPTCSISNGGGSGAACIALGRSIIEWAQQPVGTFLRTPGQLIQNMMLRSPSVAGSMAIHYATPNAPNDPTCNIGGGTVCDRMEGAEFANLFVEDDNVYNPATIYIGADCNTCSFRNIGNDPHLSSTGYQTVLLATNLWASAIGNEGDGIQYAYIDGIACGGSKNGGAPCIYGRLQRSHMANGFCDGVLISADPQVCYGLLNSSNVDMSNLSSEGQGGTEFMFNNSRHIVGQNLGIGTLKAAGTTPSTPVAGINLINTHNSTFRGTTAGGGYPSGIPRVLIDSASTHNTFLDYELVSATEASVANTTSNFIQYCLTSVCVSNAAWSTIGTAPY